MYDRILVPVDGSECGRDATEYAADLAAETGATLDLVHVVDTTIRTVGARLTESERREHGETILESAADLVEGFDCEIETHVRQGSPGDEIVESGVDRDADLIVMGRQGHRTLRARLLGGVTETVVHHAEQPVLVVPLGNEAMPSATAGVLVPTDGSENAAAAAAPAASLARTFEADLTVVTAVEVQSEGGSFNAGGVTDEFLDRLYDEGDSIVQTLAERISGLESGVTVDTLVRRGDAHEEIAAAAVEEGAELIVMASHGRTGLRRHLIGSVTDRVLRVSDTPLLIVQSDAD